MSADQITPERIAEHLGFLGDQFRHWLRYNEESHGKPDEELSGDIHVILSNGYTDAPPCWPSRSVLKNWVATMYAARDALTASRAEAQAVRKDMEDAAGELLVEIPEPGSVASKMLMANTLMRRERDTLRAEVQRLRDQRAAISDVAVRNVAEVQRLTEEARRSDAGRVEVPELTEAVMHNIQHLWPEDDARQAKEITDWFRFNASSRLSPSPQPATGAIPTAEWFSQVFDKMPDDRFGEWHRAIWLCENYAKDFFPKPSPQPATEAVDRHQLLPALPASRVSEMVEQLAGCSMEECIRDVWNTARDEINLPQPSADVVPIGRVRYLACFGPDGTTHFAVHPDGRAWQGDEIDGTIHWRTKETSTTVDGDPVPPESADVVVVPSRDALISALDDLLARRENAKATISTCMELAEAEGLSRDSLALAYLRNVIMAQPKHETIQTVNALRSSTNHDAQDAGVGR